MKSKLDRNYFIKKFNYYFLLGVKFVIAGALIGCTASKEQNIDSTSIKAPEYIE